MQTPRFSEEGRGGGSPGAGAESPRQTMEKTRLSHGGSRRSGSPHRNLRRAPCRSRSVRPEGAAAHRQPAQDKAPGRDRAGGDLLAGPTARGGPMLKQFVPGGLHPVKKTRTGAVPEGLRPVGKAHVGKVHKGLYLMGGKLRWSRGRG